MGDGYNCVNTGNSWSCAVAAAEVICGAKLGTGLAKVGSKILGKLLPKSVASKTLPQSLPSKADVLQANKAAGDTWEQTVKKGLHKSHPDVTDQVTIQTDSGVNTRIDSVGRYSSGKVYCTECKSSASAPLTPNQK